MGTHALPLLELDIDLLEKALDDEIPIDFHGLEGDLELLDEKTKDYRVRIIKKHLEEVKENPKNKFLRELKVKELIRLMRALYKRIGYSISPKGERWSLDQLNARNYMQEVEELKTQLKTELKPKLEMAKTLASYQMKFEKLSKKSADHISNCSKSMAEDNLELSKKHLSKAKKELARFILENS